jgi:hypothetical protein
MNIPIHYIPKQLSTRDHKTQKKHIQSLKKKYQQKKYVNRPKLKSFKSKKSSHVSRAKTLYKVSSLAPSRMLARKTKCSLGTLRKIANKGKGAYYSSGSRPNQTAHSWARARLASALTGGPASVTDYHLLSKGCRPGSRALRMANRTRKQKRKQ